MARDHQWIPMMMSKVAAITRVGCQSHGEMRKFQGLACRQSLLRDDGQESGHPQVRVDKISISVLHQMRGSVCATLQSQLALLKNPLELVFWLLK